MKHRAVRHRAVTYRHIFLMLAATVGLLASSCQTPGQKLQSAQTKANIAELTEKLNVSQKNLDASQAASLELQTKVTDLTNQITDLQARAVRDQARIKELEDTKTHLEDLLTRLQMLRINGLVAPLAQATPTAQPAKPSPTTAVTLPQATSTPQASALPSSTTIPVAGADLVLTDTILNSRKDRTAVRGTLLFSERDIATGNLKYYHHDFWYNKPGIFIELSGLPGSKYQASLIVQTAIEQKTPDAVFGQLTFVKGTAPGSETIPSGDFGYPSLRNYIQTPGGLLESLIYQLDALTVNRLLDVLDNPLPRWTIKYNGRPDSPVQTIDQRTRRALFEMLQAYNDLKNAPSP